MESELAKEVENGRLFRLLVKLGIVFALIANQILSFFPIPFFQLTSASPPIGFINERPEFDMDASWSETGDRYLLKLFRDYVFHQVYEDGSAVVDYAHVVECLNKVKQYRNMKDLIDRLIIYYRWKGYSITIIFFRYYYCFIKPSVGCWNNREDRFDEPG